MDRFLIKSPEKSREPKRLKLEENHTSIAGECKIEPSNSRSEEICSFGNKCYRRNIHHFREYRHPHLEELLAKMEATGELPPLGETAISKDILVEQIQTLKRLRGNLVTSVPVEASCTTSVAEGKLNDGADRNSVESTSNQEYQDELSKRRNVNRRNPYEKWKLSEPYNMFLTSIGPEQTDFSISFTDLFHPSFGAVKAICHFNFMVESFWLIDQVVESSTWGKPTTIIYGTENPGVDRLADEYNWIEVARAKSPHAFGHHHTKMTFILYEDQSMRFIVYTANLIESDWMNKTQGIWISPKCNTMSKDEPQGGDSPTGFKKDILSYLVTYQLKSVEPWIKRIRSTDCSGIKVVFVASAPNLSQSIGDNGFKWGIKKVDNVLRRHSNATVTSQWPIIAQCSSIGSLGPDNSWLQGEWGLLMEGPQKCRPTIKLVYPSVSDVKNSADGEEGADCLPYANATHSKQRWLEQHMWWVGFTYNRTYAMPHIKTYCRISPDSKEMAWFILTSANLSKAAWGRLNKKGDQLMVMSWECGVMFLPKFLTGDSSFKGSIKSKDSGSKASTRVATERNTVVYDFPVPYDLPVTEYSGANKPWLVDYLGHPRR